MPAVNTVIYIQDKFEKNMSKISYLQEKFNALVKVCPDLRTGLTKLWQHMQRRDDIVAFVTEENIKVEGNIHAVMPFDKAFDEEFSNYKEGRILSENYAGSFGLHFIRESLLYNGRAQLILVSSDIPEKKGPCFVYNRIDGILVANQAGNYDITGGSQSVMPQVCSEIS
jgi:hypothetical protein